MKKGKKMMQAAALTLCLVLTLEGCSVIDGVIDKADDIVSSVSDKISEKKRENEEDDFDDDTKDKDETKYSADKGKEQTLSVIRPMLLGSSEKSTASSVVPSVKPYTVNSDLGNVTNLEQFYIQAGSEQERLLADHMFYVETGWDKEFFEIYEKNRYSLTPNFITVDSMMHTYHLYFSYLMKKTEKNYLADTLAAMSQTILDTAVGQYEVLQGTEWENAALRNVAFFAIGAKLQNEDISVPETVSGIVSSEISKIMSASAIGDCVITGTMLDYSQFAPRGYYEGDSLLESYFRAMMWYGQIGFIQSEEDLDRSALLLTMALTGDAFKQWEAIYVVTSFFAGASDDLTWYEYYEAAKTAYGADVKAENLAGNDSGWQSFRKLTASMKPPAINSIPTVDDSDTATKTTDTNKGFRFMGQRFTIDAAIFQQLIYENVLEDNAGNKRMLPDTLDVAAALGSDEALSILENEGAADYEGYSENMAALRSGIENAEDSLWMASLYSNWLYTLTPLLEEKGEGYPSFMQSRAWTTKNLESFAGSYSELKHDTVLYAKQVMAEMGSGELPEWDDRGYVEPEPEVWSRFARLSKKTAEGLKSYGILSADDEDNLLKLETMAEQFLAITEKELANTLPSDDEFELIRNYGGNLEHFWLEAFKDEGTNITSGDFPAAIVADIATDSNGTCLEVATGNPSVLYVIVPVDGELHLCKGAVYSFYQFEQPISNRLTDSQWRQMMGIAAKDDGTYDYNSGIEQPQWTQFYRYNYE